MIKESQK